MNGQTVVGRLEHWAAKILKAKERKLVLLAASLLAGVILLGTAWEKSEPFRRLFERASSDAGEISRIKDEAKQQREIIASVFTGCYERTARNGRSRSAVC